jgi:4-hydroxythreonine-4-phosphate dehydrogenase
MEAATRTALAELPELTVTVLGPPSSLPSPAPRLHPTITGPFDGSEASAGHASLQALGKGVEMALSGQVDGLVTGPVSKPALHAAGVRVPGQTELLKDLTGAPSVGMLMHARETRLGGPLRILLATTHLPLRDVPGALTTGLLVEQTTLLRNALRDGWRLPEPRIALCALNPHASDGGLFGDEESRIMAPAVRSLQDRGIQVQGPLSADTVFLRAVEGEVDAVVVPYHDVGMAVFKTLAFGRGVNTTLGLPFIRTSPDHGTAFDLAGTGRADPSSALEAIRLAASVAGRSEL